MNTWPWWITRGLVQKKDNLNSPNPVCFIDKTPLSTRDWEITYEDYAGNFRQNINNNKGRWA